MSTVAINELHDLPCADVLDGLDAKVVRWFAGQSNDQLLAILDRIAANPAPQYGLVGVEKLMGAEAIMNIVTSLVGTVLMRRGLEINQSPLAKSAQARAAELIGRAGG